MQKVKAFFKQLWKDESAQGATEYILLLVVVVTIAFLFKDKIMEIVNGKLDDLSGSLGEFNVDR